MSALVQLNSVTKTFGNAPAVHDVDLSIERGKTTVLIGPSGCGKSTLLRLIIGLLEPDSGQIEFDGAQLTADKIDIVPEPKIAAVHQPTAGDLIPFEQPAAPETPPPPPPIKKPAPRLIPPKKKAVLEKEAAKPPKEKYVQAKQEVMQFEPITRGRFEKSEPTIVEGQDLDVPTFLRKNIRVK